MQALLSMKEKKHSIYHKEPTISSTAISDFKSKSVAVEKVENGNDRELKKGLWLRGSFLCTSAYTCSNAFDQCFNFLLKIKTGHYYILLNKAKTLKVHYDFFKYKLCKHKTRLVHLRSNTVLI